LSNIEIEFAKYRLFQNEYTIQSDTFFKMPARSCCGRLCRL